MIAFAFAAVVSAWLLGVLGVSGFWPRTKSWTAALPVILPLGLGLGLGLTSVLFFASSLMTARPARISAVLELLVGIGFAWQWWRRPRRTNSAGERVANNDFLFNAIIASIFVQAVLVAIVVSARAYAAEPLGSWDGWAIWNMHARFIFRGGAGWAELLHASQVGWTHPDYPLLVPASVARVWSWVGRDTPFASALVSGMFGVATVGLLVAVVAQVRHRLVALVGGLVLLGTPFFVTFSSNEHADIPLGFFLLATVALIALSQEESGAPGLLALAGFSAGMAAWTKNEGMMFVVVVGLVWGIYAVIRGLRWNGAFFFGGLIVALLPPLYFKLVLAPPNDVVTGQLTSRLGHLLEGARHRLILASFWRDVTRFGEWGIVPFLVMALPLVGPGWRRLNGREWITAMVVASMLIGYYGVYLLTPWDLAWHLDFSLVRLLLQLWPSVVFFWCLALTFDGTAAANAPKIRPEFRRTPVLAGILATNFVVAGVALMALSRQPAANEFDVARVGGGKVSAVIGDGWYDRETDGHSVWVWSKGESTLWLRANPRRESQTVVVRFGVRGLSMRTVSAKIAGRVVWQARVGEPMTHGEIANLSLPPGVTTVTFTTDEPGVPESVDPKARALSFALYDVRLSE